MAVLPLVYDSATGEHRPAGAGELNIVSKQTGNFLRYGNDGGAFVDGNDILSNGDDNILRIDGADNRIKLTSAQIIEIVGGEGGGGGGGSSGDATFVRSIISAELKDGGSIDTAIDTTVSSALSDGGSIDRAIDTGANSAITSALANGGAIKQAIDDALASLPTPSQPYTAGNGIDINTTRVVSVKLAPNSGMVVTSSGVSVDTSAIAEMVVPRVMADAISSDGGNSLELGSDGKLFSPMDCGVID